MAKKWIQKADIKKGALGDMAKAAGFDSWRAFCASDKAKGGKAAKRCALAKTLSKMNK